MIITAGTYTEPELTPAIVEAYTNGQLPASDPATQYMLDAALAAARNDVKWHVAPVTMGEVITLNGYGGTDLWLPTKNIVQIHAITNDGVSVDPVTGITRDADMPNKIYLNTGTWSTQRSGITITWDHGYPNAQVYDWRNAILALVTNIAQISVLGRSDAELESKEIDDVSYRWAAAKALGSVESTLSNFRMLAARV